MKPTPAGWPRLSSAVCYDDPRAAIEFLQRAFAFQPRIVVDDGAGGVAHSELTFGEAVVMVASLKGVSASPRSVGGANTQRLFLYVDDVRAHCSRAREAGAVVLVEPTLNDYGPEYWSDESYSCTDPEGHHWWFAQRIRG